MTLPDRPKDVLKWQAHLDREWLQELGRIGMFAAWVEETLHEIYWRHAELTVEIGRIITGDLRPNRLSADILNFPIRLRQVDGRTFLIRSDVGGRLCRHFAGWAGV